MRTCPRCGEEKPFDAEHFQRRPNGNLRAGVCRACISADSAARKRQARAALSKKPKPAPKPRPKPKPKPAPKPKKDCRYLANACRCETHLSPGFWARLERRAQAFADELERLDREDPEEARRRDRELLTRPAGKVSLR